MGENSAMEALAENKEVRHGGQGLQSHTSLGWGCRQALPTSTGGGMGGHCWGTMLTKHQEEAFSGQEEARSAPAHLPKPAGWERKGGRGKTQSDCQEQQHPSSTASAALAGLVFLKEGGFSTSFHQKSWGNLPVPRGSLPWSHSLGTKPKSKRSDSTSNEPPLPRFWFKVKCPLVLSPPHPENAKLYR